MKYKTFNEFWGEFLQVTFHVGHPDLWPSRERRAKWVQRHLQLSIGSKILNLGCGDGMIDVCLSRMGYQLTSVDRNTRVLKIAESIDDTQKVRFLNEDLNQINFAPESFDAILFLEASGLIGKKKEQLLFKKINSWLKPHGKFIIDCPEKVELQNSWSKDFAIGTVRCNSSFDAGSQLQNIQFYFKSISETEEFGIFDPVDPSNNDSPGIIRYLYSKPELIHLLTSTGFKPAEIDHYYEKNYYGICSEKNL